MLAKFLFNYFIVAELHSSKRRSGSAQDDHSNMILKELRMANQIGELFDEGLVNTK